MAFFQDLPLLFKCRVKRNPGRFLYNEWQVRRFEAVERRGQICGHEINRIDRVVGGEIAQIRCFQMAHKCLLAERWIYHAGSELRLMIAIANDQETLRGELLPQLFKQYTIVMGTHALTTNIFVNVWRISEFSPIRSELGTQLLIPRKMVGNGVDI